MYRVHFIEMSLTISYFSLMRINALEIIAVKPPVVIPDENMLRKVSGSWHRISGTISTLNPSEKLNAITNVALRLIFCEDIILMPAEATVPNISKVAPPKTGSGMSENIKPTAGKSPRRIKNPAM